MSQPKVLAVGSPPTFRQHVALAFGASPEEVEWIPSVIAAEEQISGAARPPDVLVLSPEIKEFDALGIAEFVGQVSATTAVILVRDRPSSGLLPAAMRAGIRDVVDMSQGNGDLEEALLRAIAWSVKLRDGAQEPATGHGGHRGKVVSIFSSKGGIGKTFLACNLAAAVAARSKRDTALVDLDVKVGDVFSYYGREPSRPVQDLVAVGDKRTRDDIVGLGTKFADHLYAFGSLPDPAAEAMGGETAGKVLRAMRGAFPYTIVDASTEYSDQTVAAFDISEEIWLLTSLDVVGVRHLLIGLETLMSLGVPRDRFRVVLNRADSKVGLDLHDVERILKVRIDATIPSSEMVPRSLNKGRPVYVQEPRSEVALAVEALANRVIGTVTTPVTNAEIAPSPKRLALRLLGLR
jgi:pilus assembly protein CpaE